MIIRSPLVVLVVTWALPAARGILNSKTPRTAVTSINHFTRSFLRKYCTWWMCRFPSIYFILCWSFRQHYILRVNKTLPFGKISIEENNSAVILNYNILVSYITLPLNRRSGVRLFRFRDVSKWNIAEHPNRMLTLVMPWDFAEYRRPFCITSPDQWKHIQNI